MAMNLMRFVFLTGLAPVLWVLGALAALAPADAFSAPETRPAPVTPAAPASSPVQAPIAAEGLVTLISPAHESYLAKRLPIVAEPLPPVAPVFDWAALKLTALEGWTYQLSPEAVTLYEQTADTLALELQKPNDPAEPEKRYLIADLQFAAALNAQGNKLSEKLSIALQSYEDALRRHPASPHAMRAKYHSGLIMTQKKRYSEGIRAIRLDESRWNRQPAWAKAFRALLMEAYFLHGRYLRAEDYLWNLSGQINRDELTSHLALRYGDSLFLQKKYPESINWYEKMKTFLDRPASPAAWVSRLYYAEALFQTGQPAKALPEYRAFQSNFRGKYPEDMIRYRVLQCRLAQAPSDQKLVLELEDLFADKEPTPMTIAARLQWARWVLATKHTRLYDDAMTALREIRRDLQKKVSTAEEALENGFLLGVIDWRRDKWQSALDQLASVIPKEVIPEFASPIVKVAAEIVSRILAEAAPGYWERKDTMGYLVLCDRLRKAIELSSRNAEILLWVGKAYIESGMPSAGARLFQRLLTKEGNTERSRERILIELAKAYSLLGEHELLKSTLDLMRQVPSSPDDLRLYHMIRGNYFVSQGKYSECVTEIATILTEGVRGDELFHVALQGAVCARKAKLFDKAEKYVGMLGADTINSSANSEKTGPLTRWQEEAFFEKTNLLAATGKQEEALEFFEKIRSAHPESEPPLETVLIMVNSYRGQGRADEALALWKEFGDKDQTLSGDAKTQFTKLLETLSQAELLPNQQPY